MHKTFTWMHTDVYEMYINDKLIYISVLCEK